MRRSGRTTAKPDWFRPETSSSGKGPPNEVSIQDENEQLPAAIGVRGPTSSKTHPPRKTSLQPVTSDILTFREANRQCFWKGSQLAEFATIAQEKNEVSSFLDTSSLRRVKYSWLVPTKCTECAKVPHLKCERAKRCKRCIKLNLSCDCHHPNHPVEMAQPRGVKRPRRQLQTSDHQATESGSPAGEPYSAGLLSAHLQVPDLRPKCRGEPEVWAMSRQALCETLPYYQSYQGGLYTWNGHCYGFLVDGHGHRRDLAEEDVIITRAGGGLKKNADGQMVQTAAQQEESAQIRAVQQNIFHKKPIVMILGEDHQTSICKAPKPYCVLGWFKPTHVWLEKDGGQLFYKYRLEKYFKEEPSWWAPEGRASGPQTLQGPPASGRQCTACGKNSPRVYEQVWTCLNGDCQECWQLSGNISAAQLTYNPLFLHQTTPWPGWDVPYPFKPDFPFSNPEDYDTSVRARQGFVCPWCGMCNSRLHWLVLKCRNAAGGCRFEHPVPPKAVPVTALEDPKRPVGYGVADPLEAIERSPQSLIVESEPQCIDGYRVHTYQFPECGKVVHLMSNKGINSREGGADHIFNEVQQADLKLERRHATQQIKGGSYTSQFSMNYGMPYKFYVNVPSTPFDEANPAIGDALSLLRGTAREVLNESEYSHEFNEMLALGYFEKQKIGFHDDGEQGIGPTIATLSLGFPATMSLRMKGKHYNGVTKKGNKVFNMAPPVPGCLQYEDRKDQHSRLAAARSHQEADAIGGEIKTTLGLSTRRMHGPTVLKLTMRHGDIVIMHGDALQKYYEHGVESQSTLRFALTCRYIDPASVLGTADAREPISPSPVMMDDSASRIPEAPAESTQLPTPERSDTAMQDFYEAMSQSELTMFSRSPTYEPTGLDDELNARIRSSYLESEASGPWFPGPEYPTSWD